MSISWRFDQRDAARDDALITPVGAGTRVGSKRELSARDGQWRIANPWRLRTELRHRWLVAQRRVSGSGWCMHDGDHATLHDARAYVEAHPDLTLPASPSAHEYWADSIGPRNA